MGISSKNDNTFLTMLLKDIQQAVSGILCLILIIWKFEILHLKREECNLDSF